MLNLSGKITRSFIFPAQLDTTIAYYSQLPEMVQLMPYITLIHAYTPNQVRVLYETIELGSYTIRIYTDLESKVVQEANEIQVYPIELEAAPPITTKTTMRESVGRGLFALTASFTDQGKQTYIEYTIQMEAKLKRPRGMRLMPKRVVNRIATGITENRTREIIDGFIRESLNAFPTWLEAQKTTC